MGHRNLTDVQGGSRLAAVPLRVNIFSSNTSHAGFLGPSAEQKKWRWYTPIRTNRPGEASHDEREGQQPLGPSAERKKWRRDRPLRTETGSRGEALGRHSNLGESQVRIGEWWRWYTPIRTALERPFNFRIYLSRTHEYQRISAKARQLRAKGLSWSEIGRKLKVTGKTAKKAVDRRKM
jgi:hypothetical protein